MKLAIFNQFHIVRLETQSEKYMALKFEMPPTLQFGNFSLISNRFIVIFERLEDQFRVKKVFSGGIMYLRCMSQKH